MQSFIPAIPMLEVFLVTDENQLHQIERFKDLGLPKMEGAIAKTCHIMNRESGEEIIVIFYPDMLEHELVSVVSTLVHEAVHAWDCIKTTYGYDDDTELNAYSIENIYTQLFNVYSKLYRKHKRKLNRKKKHAKRT